MSREGGLVLLLLFPQCIAARYQKCEFSCAGDPLPTNWTQCRTERCTPALPEDMCPDGSEPEVLSSESVLPLDCPVQPAGSFAERCGLCLGLARAATLAGMRGTIDLADGHERLCQAAREQTESLLPTVHTCRLHPYGCGSLLDDLQNSTCVRVWEQLSGGARQSAIMWQQQQQCGELLSLRSGSGVSEAELCAPPRDMGSRVVLLSVIAASALFVAQAYFSV